MPRRLFDSPVSGRSSGRPGLARPSVASPSRRHRSRANIGGPRELVASTKAPVMARVVPMPASGVRTRPHHPPTQRGPSTSAASGPGEGRRSRNPPSCPGRRGHVRSASRHRRSAPAGTPSAGRCPSFARSPAAAGGTASPACAGAGRSKRDAPATGRVVPAPEPVVVGDARDGEIGDDEIHPARIVLAGEDELARRRTDALGDDDGVVALGATVREGDGRRLPVLVDPVDAVTEAKPCRVAPGLVEEAGEVPAQDLHLGRRPSPPSLSTEELSGDPALVIDPSGSGFARSAFEGDLFQPHPAQYLTADAAHVDVLAAVPEGGCPFDYGDLVSEMGEPPCEGTAGHAGSGDEDAMSHEMSRSVVTMRGWI